LNSALCCFLFTPTSHAPLDRSAFSLSCRPKIRSRRSQGRIREQIQYHAGTSVVNGVNPPHLFLVDNGGTDAIAMSISSGGAPESLSNCRGPLMNRLKLTQERRERFLQVLADTGSVTAAVAVAGTSRTRV